MCPRTVDVAPDLAAVMMAFAMKGLGMLEAEGRRNGNFRSGRGSSEDGKMFIWSACKYATGHFTAG